MVRKRRKLPKFSGDLAKPLEAGPFPYTMPRLRPDVDRDKLHPYALLQIHVAEQLIEMEEAVTHRLELLCKHFGIGTSAPDKYRQLAIMLAAIVVPGFMPRGDAGAPKRWTPEVLANLRHDIESRMASDGITAKEACRRLLRSADGKMRYTGANSVGTLYRRYMQAKRRTNPSAKTERLKVTFS